MNRPQFDIKVASRDKKALIWFRGPFEVEDDMGFQVRIVTVEEMKGWQQIWVREMRDGKDAE